MTLVTYGPNADATILHTVTEAAGYVAAICFKTGPPALVGAELEWTVHDRRDPEAPLDPTTLRRVLGNHAPPTLTPASPHHALPGGGAVTVEPGGQLEISSAPAATLTGLRDAVESGRAHLVGLLDAADLRLGGHGIDPHRPPRRLLDTPRYAAMQHCFDAAGPHGRTMMCSTAGLQVCLDAGEPHQIAARWAAAHALGPTLLALFANSRRHAGTDTGWASARMRTWLAIDRHRSGPVGADDADPAEVWARYALAAPLLCVRRPHSDWYAPPGVTFADWINGALPDPPTTDDLEYHLGTLFPPVRPRGYLELRFLDSQPDGAWFPPVAVTAALMADDTTVDSARAAVEPVAGHWLAAARYGLADPQLAAAARRLVEVAAGALSRTDLSPADRDRVVDALARRLPGRGGARGSTTEGER